MKCTVYFRIRVIALQVRPSPHILYACAFPSRQQSYTKQSFRALRLGIMSQHVHAPPYNDSHIPHAASTILLRTLSSNSESIVMLKDTADELPSDTTPLRNHMEVNMGDQEHDGHNEITSRAMLRWWKRPNLAWYVNNILPRDG